MVFQLAIGVYLSFLLSLCNYLGSSLNLLVDFFFLHICCAELFQLLSGDKSFVVSLLHIA